MAPLLAVMSCERAEEFKRGFESRIGEVRVDFQQIPVRY